LEGIDDWYNTNFPGSTGIDDSDEKEEKADGYEEIEGWTFHPELFQYNTIYFFTVSYTIVYDISTDVFFELEIGNKDDLSWYFDGPPGYPVDYYELDKRTIYHGWPTPPKAYKVDFQESTSNLNLASSLSMVNPEEQWPQNIHNETHGNLEIAVIGKSRDHLEVWTYINVDSKANLEEFLTDVQGTLSDALQTDLMHDKQVYVTTTFNRPLSPEELRQFVSFSGLAVSSFRFKTSNSHGQATPYNNELIPLEKIKHFIAPANLVGFYRVDGYISGNKIAEVQQHPQVLLCDFSAFLALMNSQAEATQLKFHIVDPFWLWEKFFINS
jgi:hypothetical protein